MKNLLDKIKEKWNRYLKHLAESNKKTFGSGRLDCCDLNKKSPTQKKAGYGT